MSDTQRDREERQHVIEVLQKMVDWMQAANYIVAKPERIHALCYAIASIKTDLKDDLLYEETSEQADKPTTPNDCETCIHNKGVLECDMYGCKYEPTTKNDVVALDFSDDIDTPNKYQTADGKWHEGKIPIVKKDSIFEQDFITTIFEKVTETHEEFIFETIRPYCENVVNMKISKRDLEQALLKYYGKNDLEVDAISRQAVIDELKRYFHDEYYQRTSIQDCRDCFIEDVLNHLPSVTPQESRCNMT